MRRVEPDGTVRLSEGEALIRYRRFTPRELAAIVDSGTVLPAGITRFRVKERVLGVRYPLDRHDGGRPSARTPSSREFVADAGKRTGSATTESPSCSSSERRRDPACTAQRP